MVYEYQKIRPEVFNETGRQILEGVRQNVAKLLIDASSFTLEMAIKGLTGDTWTMIASIDRMVELGELVEVDPSDDKIGQQRTFKRPEWHKDQSKEGLRRYFWNGGLYMALDEKHQR